MPQLQGVTPQSLSLCALTGGQVASERCKSGQHRCSETACNTRCMRQPFARAQARFKLFAPCRQVFPRPLDLNLQSDVIYLCEKLGLDAKYVCRGTHLLAYCRPVQAVRMDLFAVRFEHSIDLDRPSFEVRLILLGDRLHLRAVRADLLTI